MVVLKAEKITSGYGDMEILHDVSIVVHKGEIISIIGPNGAGKSTLMKTVFGLLKPFRGKISLHGKEITGLPPSAIVRHGLS